MGLAHPFFCAIVCRSLFWSGLKERLQQNRPTPQSCTALRVMVRKPTAQPARAMGVNVLVVDCFMSACLILYCLKKGITILLELALAHPMHAEKTGIVFW